MSKGNLIGSALVLGVLIAAAPATATVRAEPAGVSAATATTAAAGGGWSFVDDAVCEVVGSEPISEAAKTLVTEKSHGLVGPLLADFAVSMLTSRCKALVGKAGSLMKWLYRELSTPSQPSRNAYLNSLTRQDEAAVARQILVNGRPLTAAYVASSVAALCADLRAARSPISTMERYYPHAKLDLMGAMNGVASLVIRQCGLNGTRAGFLVQAILGHLLDNQYPVDHDPPIVLLGAPTETKYTNGTGVVSAHYFRFDFTSGVKTCYVYVGYGGTWHPDGTGSATLQQGTPFAYAVRCLDNAGNYSAWSLTATYTA